MGARIPLRAAVVQAAPRCFDAAASIDVLARFVAEAARGGSQLVAFPEAFVGGYPKGLDFGARVGMRSEAGRDDFRRYHEAAIGIPGPEIARLGELAADHRVHLVGGVIERDAGTLYCTMVFLAPDGRLLGKHRKLVPTAMERLVWGQGDGSTLPVFPTPIGRLGGVICWENYMPLLRTAMYAQGVELYCVSTVDDREVWQHSMRHIAIEGRCFVLSACPAARRCDFPDDYDCVQGDDPEAWIIRGGSVIVSPFGEPLAGPVFEQECLLSAEIDLGEVARGKYDLDVVGHYARPDVFELRVDTRPHEAVVATPRGPEGAGDAD